MKQETRISWKKTMRIIQTFSVAALVFAFWHFALAVDPDNSKDKSTSNFNLATQTLGGKQFWSDELLFHQWRIQRNVITGHYRLLDEHDVRQAWGTFDECQAELEKIKSRDHLAPMSGKVVIVLHGLGRSRDATSGMASFLETNGNFEALNISYPSTMAEVEGHAQSLRRIIENLTGVDEIDFVAHSLGNLVVRSYLDEAVQEGQNHRPDRRIKRMVMLGAPNNGSQLATTLDRNPAARELIGEPGREIAEGWDKLAKHLAIPQFEFGVIAGGKGDGHGYNPLLTGDNDMIVTVAETRLPGARDFLCLPVIHTFMMNNARVQEATLKFLEHGYFVSEDQRHPVEQPK
jgi:pimeloyl-ACP methyl ester carboxylesterase